MLYVAYLDEFGHIGPYVSADHSRHKTHPVFGLGGVVLLYSHVRRFSTYFYQRKNELLAFELDRSGKHPAKWEKKGSSLFSVKNVQKYPEVRRTTYRLLSCIRSLGGFVFYVGLEKRRKDAEHDSKKLYRDVLREAIKRLDQECEHRNAKLLIILDEQEKTVMRARIVETSSISMYGVDPKRSLIEPPIQAESHLYQSLQCADWISGLVGRLSHFRCEPSVKPESKIFEDLFETRLEQVRVRSSIRFLPD